MESVPGKSVGPHRQPKYHSGHRRRTGMGIPIVPCHPRHRTRACGRGKCPCQTTRPPTERGVAQETNVVVGQPLLRLGGRAGPRRGHGFVNQTLVGIAVAKAVAKKASGRRFASATMPDYIARVAELVDARDLKSRIRKGVRVRFPSRAPSRRIAGRPDAHGTWRVQRRNRQSGSAQQDQPGCCVRAGPDDGVLVELPTNGAGLVQRDARNQKTRFTGPLTARVFANAVEHHEAPRRQHACELGLMSNVGFGVYRLAIWVARRDKCAAVNRQRLMQDRQAIRMDVGTKHHGIYTPHSVFRLAVGLCQSQIDMRCRSHDADREEKLEARPGIEPG